LGIGTTLALGRFSGFFSPAIVFPLYAYDSFSPFLFGTITLIVIDIIVNLDNVANIHVLPKGFD